MALQISDRVREQTKQCLFTFQCLEEATRNVCKINTYIEDNVCFLSDVKNHACHYRKKLGPSYYICNCPIRYELFRRYHI